MLNVITFDLDGQIATEETAASWQDELGLSWLVVADVAGEWMAKWGGDNGRSQHSYTVLDAEGRVSWKRHDGSSEDVSVIIDAIEAAVPDLE